MMKLGESINPEDLFDPVLCACRRRWRRRQPLLLLSLQTGEIAYFEKEVLSWQEQLSETLQTCKVLQMNYANYCYNMR